MSEWIEKYSIKINGKYTNKNKFSSCEGNSKSQRMPIIVNEKRVPLLFGVYFSTFLFL